ncbi:MAG: hypothetical protein PHV77_02485 [Candidatus Omnitrophica bacterium]|jgi:methyl-accepting chemotaxis protein|nr:hypothetical protein [Candidatus Omnitrophota bacterium]
MIGQKDSRRKNYFIKKKFQGIFILRFCLLMGIGLAVSALGLYLYSRSSTTTSFIHSRLSIVNTSDYILPALIWAVLLVLFVMGIITTLVVMYMSHRIAGAMFNIEHRLNQIGNGDLTAYIKLRSTDQAQDMAEGVNSIAKVLSEKLSEMKKIMSGINDDISKIDKNNPGNFLENGLGNLAGRIKELSEKLNYFKTDGK